MTAAGRVMHTPTGVDGTITRVTGGLFPTGDGYHVQLDNGWKIITTRDKLIPIEEARCPPHPHAGA